MAEPEVPVGTAILCMAYGSPVDESAIEAYFTHIRGGRKPSPEALAELIARCEAAGARQMLAVIGDAENKGSIGVHSALGFEHTGVLKSAGWKFGRWLDVVLMQRPLGEGDSTAAA